MRENLTRQAVDQAAPRAKPYRLHDAKVPGLFLRVQPSGVRVWYVAYSRNAATPLGRYPAITLDHARTKALKALSEAREHGAPSHVIAKRVRAAKATGDRIETLGELLEHRYSAWVLAERKAGAATLAALKADFGAWYTRKLTDLSAWHLERYKADRLKLGRKPSTVNRELVRIKAVVSKAIEWGLLENDPFRTVKPAKVDDNGRVRFLSDSEETRLRDALAQRDSIRRARRENANEWRDARGRDPKPAWAANDYTDHLTPITLLALNTGLRRGELFSLTWADVDAERKIVTVRGSTAKAGRTRHVPLNSEAERALTRWRGKAERVGLVFPGPGGGRMSNIATSWAELMAAAKLDNFRFHDCRHHFASRLVMAGVDLNTVRELLGHADIAMTLRYAHLAPQHKADAVSKLVRPSATAARRR